MYYDRFVLRLDGIVLRYVMYKDMSRSGIGYIRHYTTIFSTAGFFSNSLGPPAPAPAVR